MREPSLRTSRLAIAGGLVAVAVVGGAGFYLGRSSSDPGKAAQAVVQPTPSPLPPVSQVVADSVLGRAELIELVAAAADAAASEEALPEAVRRAVDRRFEIAVPFGCSGGAEADSEDALRWRYDEEAEVLRLHVAVTRWQAADWGLDWTGADGAIEGFWIARPWSSSGACPQRPAPPSTTAQGTSVEQTLAVAQFLPGDVRREAFRDGRPFESVQRIARSDFTAPQGFRLLLSGRLDRVPGSEGLPSPVHCIQPVGIDQRPRCIVAISLDEVRIENPTTGAVLASWPIGSD